MDDNSPKENPPPDFNKLDLTQLQGFSFGTQWSQEKPSAPDQRDRGEHGGDRPRREDRRDSGGPDRRDRRGIRRPAGPGSGEGGGPAPAGGVPDRREQGGGGYQRREGGEAPRPSYGGGDRGPRPAYAGRGAPIDRGPYESPFYTVMFYPEDTSFNTLVQTIRKSCRTVELFEIARTVVAKTDRFVVVVAPRAPGASGRGNEVPAAADSAAKRPVFHISVPDGLPFESDEAAVAHVMANHLGTFFESAEVEVEPPKGNFQVINKCGVTGELLGPPNYHRYNQILQQHHAAKVARMPLDMYRNRIETIRDPEVVAQWLAKMKKTTRYTWKTGAKAALAAAPAVEAPAAEASVPAAETAPASEVPVPAAPEVASAAPTETAAPAVSTVSTFDSVEDARLYLLTQVRDKVVRTTETVRFHGKLAETMPQGEIRRAIEGALERQQRFPLDTANALRGRLRREHVTIFKKGSKGVSYVCAVKRKFRVPGQTFSDSIGGLISFIEKTPMVRASELATKFLGFAPVAAPKPVEPSAEGAEVTAKPEPTFSVEDRARLSRLQGDLMWLVREGYVTEFIDGRLFAPPPMVEARKKEIEVEEHDPENFPEAPPTTTESAAPAQAAPIAEAEPETPVVPAPAADPVEATSEALAPETEEPKDPASPAGA